MSFYGIFRLMPRREQMPTILFYNGVLRSNCYFYYRKWARKVVCIDKGCISDRGAPFGKCEFMKNDYWT